MTSPDPTEDKRRLTEPGGKGPPGPETPAVPGATFADTLSFLWRRLIQGGTQVIRTRGALLPLVAMLALIATVVWFIIGGEFDYWVRGLLVGSLSAIALYAILYPADIRQALAGRSVRYSSNALVLSIAALGIVILVNYLSNRYYKRFDTTAAKLHSLSPQSIQILQELDVDIEVIGLYPAGQDQDRFEEWIDEYLAHTDRLHYRTLDPIRQPGETDRLGWDLYGAGLIVRRSAASGASQQEQRVRAADEQDITSAILKVSRDTQKVVYFLTGHNEHSPTDFEGPGYSEIGALLEDNNFQVRTLNLVVTGTVPSDASVVVVAGPETQLLKEEQDRLTRYLLMGGKALILIDPGPETGINDVLLPWKVGIENKLVIDGWQSLSGDPATPVIDRYAFSQITKDMANLLIAMPLACPIQSPPSPQPGTAEAAIVFTPLATTSENSWAEADADALLSAENPQIQFDEGADLRGPLTLIATLESPSASSSSQGGGSGDKTRIVLIGDSDFAINDILRQIPNGETLLLNAINWLAEEESLIAIGPKTQQTQQIHLTRVQEATVCLGTLILIPAIIVVAGVAVWLNRR